MQASCEYILHEWTTVYPHSGLADIMQMVQFLLWMQDVDFWFALMDCGAILHLTKPGAPCVYPLVGAETSSTICYPEYWLFRDVCHEFGLSRYRLDSLPELWDNDDPFSLCVDYRLPETLRKIANKLRHGWHVEITTRTGEVLETL